MGAVLRVLMMIVFAIALCSCGPEVVPSTEKRSPSSPEAVKIYQHKPHRYEDLGSVSLPITPGLSWDKNGDANSAFDEMKARAAALGANGLLLEIEPGRYNILTQAGYQATFYEVPMKDKAALGEAIYVLEE